MELTGEVRIGAARERVWAALNDPAVLARSIDGMERLEPDGANRFAGTLKAAVGPVRASFTGTVTLSDIDPPSRYVLTGEGKGGAAGFVKGSAEVTLEELGPAETLLRYVARSQVGGKLAQLGGRLIEGTARGYADRFFARLKAEVEAPAAAEAPVPPAEGIEPPAVRIETPAPPGVPPLVWITALLLIVGLVLYLLA